MKISVIIPAFNEEQVISDTIQSVDLYLHEHFEDYEILVVDDGSKDRTAAIVQASDCRNVKLISYEPNQGKGYAVRQGMLRAEGEIIFCTDADLAYGLKVIEEAFSQFGSKDVDLIIGSRKLDKSSYSGYPLIRKIASKCFSAISYLLSGMCYDTQCGFKAFRNGAAKHIFEKCNENGFSFDFEVMMLVDALQMKVGQMPVYIINHRASRVNVMRDSVQMLMDIIRIRKNIKSNAGKY